MTKLEHTGTMLIAGLLKSVFLFLWTAASDGILTIENLVKKNLPLVNWCCLCRCDEKTVDHLLHYCKFAHALWSVVFLMFGVQWVMPIIVLSSFCLEEFVGGNYSSNVWNMVPACLIWLAWKKRNARTFENIERPIDLLKSSLARTLFEWSRIWGLTLCISLFDFIISVRFSI